MLPKILFILNFSLSLCRILRGYENLFWKDAEKMITHKWADILKNFWFAALYSKALLISFKK